MRELLAFVSCATTLRGLFKPHHLQSSVDVLLAESSNLWHRAAPNSGSNLLIRAPLPQGSRRSPSPNRCRLPMKSSQHLFQLLLAISVGPSHTFSRHPGFLPRRSHRRQSPHEIFKKSLVLFQMKSWAILCHHWGQINPINIIRTRNAKLRFDQTAG
jgi:hypothetical protein